MDAHEFQKIQELHDEANHLEERVQYIDQQAKELETFITILDRLKESPNGEILASLGKGVFAKTTITETDLFVDVGAGIIARQSPHQILTTVKEQQIKLQAMREETLEKLDETQQGLAEFLQRYKSTE